MKKQIKNTNYRDYLIICLRRRMKEDLENRLYKAYDKIEPIERSLIASKAKRRNIEAEKLTGDNID